MTYDTWEKMPLSRMAREVAKGYADSPALIQMMAIPTIVQADYNIVVSAKNGTGKSGVIFIGILSRIDPKLHELQAVVIGPTRPLVIQLHTEFCKIAEVHIKDGVLREPALAIGRGDNHNQHIIKDAAVENALRHNPLEQIDELKNLSAGAQVLFTTVGKLCWLIKNQYITNKRIIMVAVDEVVRTYFFFLLLFYLVSSRLDRRRNSTMTRVVIFVMLWMPSVTNVCPRCKLC